MDVSAYLELLANYIIAGVIGSIIGLVNCFSVENFNNFSDENGALSYLGYLFVFFIEHFYFHFNIFNESFLPIAWCLSYSICPYFSGLLKRLNLLA